MLLMVLINAHPGRKDQTPSVSLERESRKHSALFPLYSALFSLSILLSILSLFSHTHCWMMFIAEKDADLAELRDWLRYDMDTD
jgi:hypothetical protein